MTGSEWQCREDSLNLQMTSIPIDCSTTLSTRPVRASTPRSLACSHKKGESPKLVVALIKRKIAFGLLTQRECLPNARMNDTIHAKADRAVDTRQRAIVSKGIVDFGR